MTQNQIIGIDLGTTNSAMAILEDGEPKIIPNSHGARTTPSVVAFKGKRYLVGAVAKRQELVNSNTVSNVKTHLGDSNYKINVEGQVCTPVQIEGMILLYLRQSASKALGFNVTQAVITVPAYFNDNQRRETAQAGKIAGLTVRRIINEPTAASLAYGLHRQQPQKIMVFDFGGGTLDVSILQLNAHGVFQVLSTNGNTHLGGNDFDRILMLYIIDSFKHQNHIDLSKNVMAMQRLKSATEQAKIKLSNQPSTTINIPFITNSSHGPLNLKITITRKIFNLLTQNLVNKAKIPVDKTLQDAGLSVKDIGQVILNGGTTRIPSVRQALMQWTHHKLNTSINPDEAVALGAAIQGGMLTGQMHNVSLLDVTPMTLGLEMYGHKFAPLIKRDTTIPASKTENFTTVADGQDHVSVHIFQGESANTTQDSELGTLTLSNIPSQPRGVPQIAVTFDIDKNGIVQVSAKDIASGKKQQVKIALGNTGNN